MIRERQNWRDYQKSLKKTAARKKMLQSVTRMSAILTVLAITLYAVYVSAPGPKEPPAPVAKTTPEVNEPQYSKADLQSLINQRDLSNITRDEFKIQVGEKTLRVETSIDGQLQNYLLKKFEKVKTLKRGNPRYIAIVVMDPESGKILSMAGYDKNGTLDNPCLYGSYPAASLFKIVTAAAAVEECGLTPRSKLKFNGNKYTLYKNQLKEKTNKYTNRISFRDSFAQSVNPVFGKLGSLYLGKLSLEKYATAFGFNRTINFETNVPESQVTLSDEPYQWAEIACGFNRETLISPLHGVLLSGTIVNNGVLPEPTIIEQVTDNAGVVLYKSAPGPVGQAIKPETSTVIKKLMETTISSGTGRKSFRGYKKDPVLSKLYLGGKTGSIYNKGHNVRLDWFVGFAEEKNGTMKLAVSVLVGHEKYIGTKACNYAKMAIKHYFDTQFAQLETTQLFAHGKPSNQVLMKH